MFIYLRLLLAHFIGDFPLQVNKVYALKHKGIEGGIPHALILTGCYIIFSWPYLNLPGVWSFIVFLGVAHLFQDSIKLAYKDLRYSFWAYVLDQIFHAAIIAMLFFAPLKNLKPPEGSSFIVLLYNDNLFVIYLIALILATYNGYYLIRNLKNTFLRKVCSCSDFEKKYGILERALLVTMFLMDKYIFLFVALIFLARPLVFIIAGRRLGLKRDFMTGSEPILSWAVAILTGILLFLVKQRFT
jgi:hypothetical protein